MSGPLRTGSTENVKCFKGSTRSVFQKGWGNGEAHTKFEFGAVWFQYYDFLCMNVSVMCGVFFFFFYIHYLFTHCTLSLHAWLFFLNILIKEHFGLIMFIIL